MFNFTRYLSKKNHRDKIRDIEKKLIIRIPNNEITYRKYGDIILENNKPSFFQRIVLYIYSFRIFATINKKTITPTY